MSDAVSNCVRTVLSILQRRHLWLWAWFAILIAVRFPYLRIGTAPYAEEAAIYLRYAMGTSATDALSQPHIGYLALFSNLTGVVEAALPWSMIPYASVAAGIVGPSLVVAVLMRAGAGTMRTALCITAVVFTTTMIREWHSPIHFQFWAVCALVMLAGAPPVTTWHRVGDHVLAVFAGLSGAVALTAVPALALASRQSVEHRKHYVRVVGLLVASGAINLLVGEGRERTMPIGRLAFFVLLKTIWQPLTGQEGVDLGADAYRIDGPLAALVLYVLLGGYVVLLWRSTRNGWNVVAVGAVVAATGMLWFSLPPSGNLLSPFQGGRYVVVGVVPVLCALIMSVRPGRGRDLVVVISTVAIVHGGLAAVASRPTARAEAEAFAHDVDLAADDAGVTVRAGYGCRLSPDPTEQRRGFSAERSGELTFSVEASDVDRSRATDVFAVTSSFSGWGFIDATGYHSLDGYYFGGSVPDQPGWCFVGTPPEPVAAAARGPVTVEFSTALVESLPDGVVVYLGRGRSFTDALGKQTFTAVPLNEP